MNYEYLSWAGIGLSGLLLLAVIWLALRVRRLDNLRREFFMDDVQKTVDDVIVQHNQQLKHLDERVGGLEQYTAGLSQANLKNLQKIGFIRFNPFNDAGGSISFVVALLDAQDNGVVISSLHGREGNRMYAKEITKGVSKSQLTEEEQEAIKQAK